MKISIDILSNYFAQFLAAVLSFVFMPFYLKELGAASYGVVGLFAIAQAIFSLLDVGLCHSLTRELRSNSHHARALRLSRQFVKIFFYGFLSLGVLFFLASDIVHLSYSSQLNFLGKDSLRVLLPVMCVLIGLRSVDSIFKSTLYGLNMQARYSIIVSFVAIAKVTGLYLLLPMIAEDKLLLFFGWQLLCSAVLALLLGSQVANKTKSCADNSTPTMLSNNSSNRGVFGFAGNVSFLSLIALFYTQLDKLFVAGSTSLSSFGYYTFASTAAAAIAFLATPVMNALYPYFCELSSSVNTIALVISFRKSTQLVNILVLSFASVGVAFSGEILLIWTRSSELSGQTSLLFSLLLLVNSFVCIAMMPNSLLLAQGKVSLLQRQMLFNTFAYFLLLLYLVPSYGPIGAALSWLLSALAYLFATVRFNLKSLEISGLSYFFARDLLVTVAVTFGISFLFKNIFEYIDLSVYWAIGLSLFGCLVGSLTCLRGFNLGLISRFLSTTSKS